MCWLGVFWKPRQAVTGEWDMTNLIGGAIPHIHPEDGNCNVYETLDNFQHSTQLIQESRSFTFTIYHVIAEDF
jgi:hypothetical protein